MPHLYLRFTGPVRVDGDGVDGGVDGELDWLMREDDGTRREGRVAASALAELVGEDDWPSDPGNVTAFVPVAETLAITCPVPGRNVAQLRGAARYAVEEYLTEDIDAMHVACGRLARGEPVRCLVAPVARMQAWLACLAAADLEPGLLTADAMALPAAAEGGDADADVVSVLFEDGAALVRAGDQVANVDMANVPAAIAAIRAAAGEGALTHLRQFGGALPDAAVQAAGFAADSVDAVAVDGPVLGFLADQQHAPAAAPVNLLQGDFAVKRRPGGAWAHWRPAAMLAGVAGALVLALWTAQGVWAGHRADTLRDEARQLYREVFDTERVPGPPATLMRRRLGQAPAETAGFHVLLGELGAALGATGAFELSSLTFAERNGLVADVLVADYDAVETLQNALAQRGLTVEVGSAEQQEGRVRTSLRIANRAAG